MQLAMKSKNHSSSFLQIIPSQTLYMIDVLLCLLQNLERSERPL